MSRRSCSVIPCLFHLSTTFSYPLPFSHSFSLSLSLSLPLPSLPLSLSLSLSRPELPCSVCDKLTRGSKGTKKALSFVPWTSFPAHTDSHMHTLRHAHTQGRLARRGLPWRQDQGEKEGKRRDGWRRGGMDDGQGLILFFFLFLSVSLPLKMQLPFFFFSSVFSTWLLGGRKVRIALQLFYLLSPLCVQSNAALSHSRRLGIRESEVTNWRMRRKER